MTRLVAAVLVAGLTIVVPSAAQVGSGKIAVVAGDGLYTINPDGTGRTLLKDGSGLSSARWSPDGSRVAFIDSGRLMVMDADGSNEHVVAAPGSIALSRQPWSPDGARIAWGPSPGWDGDVYTANASGGDVRRLTFTSGVGSPPSWSPTGSALVYSRRIFVPPYDEPLFVIGADGSGERQIAPFGREPTWSPSGEWIAFGGVQVVRPDGSDLHTVTPPGLSGRSPTWSPDGSKIAFGRYVYGRTEVASADVYLVDADGSHLKRLNRASSAKFAWAPVWSPDGDRILFHSGTVVTVNADGTCAMRSAGATRDGAEISSWQPLPNGPPAGRLRCHAISVTGAVTGETPTAVVITATVENEGTESLTKVTLEVPAYDDVSPAAASRGCTVRRGKVTCLLPRLEPGDPHRFSVRLEARRLPRTGGIIRLPARLRADASEKLLLSGIEETSVPVAIKRCTERDRGGGTIRGTFSADRICGRRGADRIYPGRGNDVVRAGGGNDVIVAVDGRHNRDQISCGPGRDRVSADRHDRIARDCERVSRP